MTARLFQSRLGDKVTTEQDEEELSDRNGSIPQRRGFSLKAFARPRDGMIFVIFSSANKTILYSGFADLDSASCLLDERSMAMVIPVVGFVVQILGILNLSG